MKQKQTPKELLQHLMKMDDLEYGRMVMATANQYLQKVLICDKEGKKMLFRHRYFWVWWSRQWERRNKILIEDLHLDQLYSLPVDQELASWIRTEYFRTHSIEQLNILPNRLVLSSSFSAY